MRLRRGRFLAWLRSCKPEEVVGSGRDCLTCPLATFYAFASGGGEVVIYDDGDGYVADRGYSKRRLPWWAARFVNVVDGREREDVTAALAIELLVKHA